MKPSVGTLLKFGPPTFKITRVLDILDLHWIVLYEIRPKKRAFSSPEKHLLADITEDLRVGVIEIVPKDEYQPIASLYRNREELSPLRQAVENRKDEKLREAHKVISDLLARAGAEIYEKSGYRHFTKMAAADSGHPQQVVRRWLNAWWRGGGVPEALRPDYSKVGLIKSPRPMETSFGDGNRPTRHWLAPETRQAIKEFALATAASRNSIKQLHADFLEKYFVEGVEAITADGIRQKRLLPPGQYPSFLAFKKYFYRDRKEEAFSKKKHGEIGFNKDHRPLTSSSIARTHGPGSRIEFDFTIASTYVVSRLNRSQILGKPVVGVAWDVYTGAPVGLLSTLERSSEMQLRLLFENILSDKVEFCARYNITISPEEWPMRHVPKMMVGDRGEGRGEIGDQFADRFNLTWVNLPRSRPDLKPTVESGFSKMERQTKFLPGWEPQYWKRDDPDAAENAALDLDQFTNLVIRVLLQHLKTANPDRYVDPVARQNGIYPSPLNLWQFGMENISGILRQELNSDILRLKVFPQANAQITKSGVRFKGLEYEHDDLKDDFVRARSTGNNSITVVYNPHCVDRVWFRRAKGTIDFIPCELTHKWRGYAGLSFPEFQLIQQRVKELETQAHHEKLESELNSRSAMKQVIDQGRAMTLEAKRKAGMGPTQYSNKNMRQHRADEAQDRARENLGSASPPPEPRHIPNKVVPFPGGSNAPEADSEAGDPEDDISTLDPLDPIAAKYLKNYKKSL